MDRVTRARIDSLLYEVRRSRDRTSWSAEDLGRRYCLDPMIVRRLLEAEGIEVRQERDSTDPDPNQSTLVMNVDDLGLDRN